MFISKKKHKQLMIEAETRLYEKFDQDRARMYEEHWREQKERDDRERFIALEKRIAEIEKYLGLVKEGCMRCCHANVEEEVFPR